MEIFLIKLISFIGSILWIYMWILVIAAIMSWLNPDPYNPIVRFFRGVTEPVLRRVRRLVPTRFGGLDIAPLLVILVIILIQQVVLSGLASSLLASAMNAG